MADAAKEEFVAFLEALQRPYNCPVCGNDRWVAASGQSISPDPMMLSTLQPDGMPHDGIGVGVVGLACTNCGFVRLHSQAALGRMHIGNQPPKPT